MSGSQNHGARASNDDTQDKPAQQHDESRSDRPDEHRVITCGARAADQPGDDGERPRFAGRGTDGSDQTRDGREPCRPPPWPEARGEKLPPASPAWGTERAAAATKT